VQFCFAVIETLNLLVLKRKTLMEHRTCLKRLRVRTKCAPPEILRKIVYLNKCFRLEIHTLFKSTRIKSFYIQIQIPEKDSKRCGDQSGLRPSQPLRAGFSTAYAGGRETHWAKQHEWRPDSVSRKTSYISLLFLTFQKVTFS